MVLAEKISTDILSSGECLPWPVVTGCERLTPGCDNCPTYWEYKKNGLDYSPVAHTDALYIPYSNQYTGTYEVAPGSDLFHESIPVEFIQLVFKMMKMCPWHQFEVVTKRAERMEMVSNKFIEWPDNVLAGVAVEEERYVWRIDCLRRIAARRMVSFGPIVNRIGKVNLSGISRARVVPESWGPKPRKCKESWISEIKTQCEDQGTLFVNNIWICKETF